MVDAMSVVNELTEMPDGTPGLATAAELEVPPVEVLPQAATTRAAVPTRVSLLAFDRSRSPRPLIPSCKCIRALPSKPDPSFYDSVRSGSGRRLHQTSVGRFRMER